MASPSPEALVFDPYDWHFHEDPYPTYRRLRDEAPVYRNEELGFVALTRHADVLAGFRDSERLSNRMGVALEAMSPESWRVASFLAMDPPNHGRLRGLVSRGFTPRRVRQLEPRIREMARSYLDAFAAKGECDFISDFAGRLPMDVVSELLGVPQADRGQLREWSDLVVEREDGGGPTVPAAAGAASGKLLSYYNAFVQERLAAGADLDTLTDVLLRHEEDGERLTPEEVVSFLFLMVVAGNETTTKLLGNAVTHLGRNPEQRKKVLADPSLIPGWVEETLRYDASSQVLYRIVDEPLELHGETIREGEFVALVVGAANRDERVFAEPDRYDVTRDNRQSLAFGQGTHFCLGASLARLEAIVALEELQARLPDWEVQEEGLVRIHSGNVRGFASVPMRFTANA